MHPSAPPSICALLELLTNIFRFRSDISGRGSSVSLCHVVCFIPEVLDAPQSARQFRRFEYQICAMDIAVVGAGGWCERLRFVVFFEACKFPLHCWSPILFGVWRPHGFTVEIRHRNGRWRYKVFVPVVHAWATKSFTRAHGIPGSPELTGLANRRSALCCRPLVPIGW